MIAFFVVECTCGQEVCRRRVGKANLPEPTNREIAASVGEAHQFNHDWNGDPEHEQIVRREEVVV